MDRLCLWTNPHQKFYRKDRDTKIWEIMFTYKESHIYFWLRYSAYVTTTSNVSTSISFRLNILRDDLRVLSVLNTTLPSSLYFYRNTEETDRETVKIPTTVVESISMEPWSWFFTEMYFGFNWIRIHQKVYTNITKTKDTISVEKTLVTTVILWQKWEKTLGSVGWGDEQSMRNRKILIMKRTVESM